MPSGFGAGRFQGIAYRKEPPITPDIFYGITYFSGKLGAGVYSGAGSDFFDAIAADDDLLIGGAPRYTTQTEGEGVYITFDPEVPTPTGPPLLERKVTGIPANSEFGTGIAMNSTHYAVSSPGELDIPTILAGQIRVYQRSNDSLVSTINHTASGRYIGQMMRMNDTYFVGRQGAYLHYYNLGSWTLDQTVSTGSTGGTFNVDMHNDRVITGRILWDASTKAQIHEFTVPFDAPSASTFGYNAAMNGQYIAISSVLFPSDGRVFIYDASTLSLLYSLYQPDYYFGTRMDINDDILAVNSANGVYVYQLSASGATQLRIFNDMPTSQRGSVVLTDDKTLYCGDGTTTIYQYRGFA